MSNLTPDTQRLLTEARQAAQNAYAPYSRFRVGAALLLENGAVVTGANVENASYGLTICAERSALVRAVAQYGPAIRIQAIAVANLNDAASPPCGACRQMLREFASPQAQINFPGDAGGVHCTMGDLLPHSFELSPRGPDSNRP